MFTIKHINASGAEEISAAQSVRLAPGTETFISDDGKTGQSGTPKTIWADATPITGGTVFVMNEHGKTVARYDLGASPVPCMSGSLDDPRPQGLFTA